MFEYKAKCVRVLDGDTMDFQMDLGFNMTTIQRVRLLGVDAPETRTLDLNEKRAGFAVKYQVAALISNAKEIKVKTHKTGKFGRWLGIVWCDDVNLNEQVKEWTNEAYTINEHDHTT